MNRLHSSLIILTLSLLAGSAEAQTLPTLLSRIGKYFTYSNGAPEGNRLGSAVSGLGSQTGDINGDGRPDFLIGASKWGTNSQQETRGRVLAYDGSGNILCSVTGTQPGDNLGSGVSFAGDLTGDGRDEILAGASQHKTGNTLSHAGAVYLIDCATQTILKTFEGEAEYDSVGVAFSSLGDVSGDGIPDLAIASPRRDSNGLTDNGEVKIYSGASGYALLRTLSGYHSADAFGSSLSVVPDLNGDGRDDLIVGAPYADPNGKSAAGSVYVFSGASGSLLFQKDGTNSYDHFGISVSGSADMNSDGRGEFIVGAEVLTGGTGYARVYSGTGLLLFTRFGGYGDRFGFSVSGVGDITGDGYPDFAVGAPWDDSQGLNANGSLSVYSGVSGSLAFKLEGTRNDQQQGCRTGAAGDANGDGRNDLITAGCTSVTIPKPNPPPNDPDPFFHPQVGSFGLFSGN